MELDPYTYVQPFMRYSMIDDSFQDEISGVSSLKEQIQLGRNERLKRKAIEKKKAEKDKKVNPVKIYKESKRRQERRR